MSSKDSSATKGTRKYREKIEGAAKWLDESHTREDKNSFRIMNKIFDESLVVLKFQEELKSIIEESEDEVSQEDSTTIEIFKLPFKVPEDHVFKKFLEIDIKSVLIELKEDKSNASLKGIFVRLQNKIKDFYSLTLEEHDMTHDEREFKRKWKTAVKQFHLD